MSEEHSIARRTNRPKDLRGGPVAEVRPSEREAPFVEADRDMREREDRIGRSRGGEDFVRRIRSL